MLCILQEAVGIKKLKSWVFFSTNSWNHNRSKKLNQSSHAKNKQRENPNSQDSLKMSSGISKSKEMKENRRESEGKSARKRRRQRNSPLEVVDSQGSQA